MMLTFEKAWEKYHAFMIRCNYSKVTLGKKEAYLRLFNRWLLSNHGVALNDLRGVSCDNLLEYMDYLFLQGLEAYTIKIYIAHLKGFFGFLYKHDFIEGDPTRKMPFIKTSKKEVVYIPHDEIIGTLDNMFINFKKGARHKVVLRDYFIIRCAYVTGWRASESLGCEVDNINWDSGEVYLPRRKGGKDGFVYLDQKTLKEMKSWYFSRYPNGKFLWYSQNGKRLSYEAYNGVFIKYFGKSSHRVRASLATYLIGQGVGVKDVADILGHENITTTMKYAAAVKTRIRDIHAQKNPFFV